MHVAFNIEFSDFAKEIHWWIGAERAGHCGEDRLLGPRRGVPTRDGGYLSLTISQWMIASKNDKP